MNRHKLFSYLVAFSFVFISASTSLALPIDFYDSNNNLSNSGSNGTMPANVLFTSHSFTFSLANDVNLNDVSLQLDLLSFDHNFSIEINGTTIVPAQVDTNNPALFSPYVFTPWYPNSIGLPRLTVDITELLINFTASLQTSSNTMTPVNYLTQLLTLPIFQLGINTIVLTNPNGIGPDGINFTISGDDGKSAVPEPATMFLFGTGIISLAGLRMKTRKK
jgi:hypothetical protein